ncbi:MAG: hypothetical protein WAM39_02810 [Bryobacteraceae bacterium]
MNSSTGYKRINEIATVNLFAFILTGLHLNENGMSDNFVDLPENQISHIQFFCH